MVFPGSLGLTVTIVLVIDFFVIVAAAWRDDVIDIFRPFPFILTNRAVLIPCIPSAICGYTNYDCAACSYPGSRLVEAVIKDDTTNSCLQEYWGVAALAACCYCEV
jgi:hypothetical protein